MSHIVFGYVLTQNTVEAVKLMEAHWRAPECEVDTVVIEIPARTTPTNLPEFP